MKKTVIQNLILVLLLVWIVSLFGLLYETNNTQNIQISLLNQLEIKIRDESEFNIGKFVKDCDVFLRKIEKGSSLSAEEYFFVAYKYRLEYDDENTLKYSRLAVEKIDRNTDTLVKFYISFIINKVLDHVEDKEELMNLGDKIFETTTLKQLNDNFLAVISYMESSITIGGSYEYFRYINELLEKEQSKLKIELYRSIKSNLSVCYYINGQFAKSIEKSLEVISSYEDEIKNDTYEYKYKAYKMLGIVYENLGDLDTAKSYYTEGLNLNSNMTMPEMYTKQELLAATIYIDTYSGNYDLVKKNLDKYEYLTQLEDVNGLTISFNLNLANYYIEVNDLSSAHEFIIISDDLINKYGKQIGISLNEDLSLLKANLYTSEGKVDESIELYKNVLEKSELNAIHKKYALQNLIKLFNQEGNFETALKYANELEEVYKDTAQHINKDYIDYSNEKYKYELELKNLNKKKIQQYLFIFIIILFSTCLIIGFIMKNSKLKVLNMIDGLTKTLNRNEFNKRYEKIINSKENFSLLIYDIDNFKKVNDTYGHVAGDNVLKKVAYISKSVIGNEGDLFRYGGEEFVVIIKDTNDDKLVKIAEKIRKEVENIEHEIKGLNTTISIGIANSNEPIDDVLHAADKRLYLSKMSGKNKFTYK